MSDPKVELRACLCGRDDMSVASQWPPIREDYGAYVECDCGAFMFGKDEDDAVAKWNARTLAAAPQPDPHPGYAPCPTCRQYSHSLGDDALAEAFNHFQAMYSHRGDGIPTQHSFDEETRDAAQVLMTAARAHPSAAPLPREPTEAMIGAARDAIKAEIFLSHMAIRRMLIAAYDAATPSPGPSGEIRDAALEEAATIADNMNAGVVAWHIRALKSLGRED